MKWRSVASSAESLHSSDGVALLITVLILFIVSVLGAAVVGLGTVDYELSGNFRAHATAFHLAESGIETTAADLLTSYSVDPGNNWLRDWIDTSSDVAVVDPFPDPTNTTINGHSLAMAATTPSPYPGTPYSVGGALALGNGTYERIVWLPPTVSSSAGIDTVEFRVRSIGTDPNQANPSEVVIDAVVAVAVGDVGGTRSGVFLGDGDGGDVLKGNRVTSPVRCSSSAAGTTRSSASVLSRRSPTITTVSRAPRAGSALWPPSCRPSMAPTSTAKRWRRSTPSYASRTRG
jgi:hypothetical protein